MWFILLHLLVLHDPDGREVVINIAEIASIRQPREDSGDHFPKGTNCLVYMSSGKFVSSAETCRDVIKQIGDLDK